MGTDPFRLRRFVEAQGQREYESILEELRSGQKYGHWMWYVFPQIQGLGWSAMSQRYAISGQEEARAYVEHATLGSRLRECTQLVIALDGRRAEQIFPYPDNLKFCSCMTLFAETSTDPGIFRIALNKYFHGESDPLTLDILRKKEG